MAYATVPELTEFLGHTPEQAGRMIDRASRLVNYELISARYDPTSTAVVDALRESVLEQCAEWDTAGADGTEAGDPGQWSNVSAGSIALGRGSRSGGGGSSAVSTTTRLTHQARLVLQQAGLTGHAPRTGGW